MNKKITFLVLIFTVTGILFSRSRNDGDVSLLTSYVLPVDNTNFNSSLVLGLGAGFWGVFEFKFNAYLEIDRHQDNFFDKFKSPNVFSAGVGMNIPMGGFNLKGDYQKFFSVADLDDQFGISQFTASYMYGIGIDITRDLELNGYYRGLFSGTFTGDSQGLVGIGAKLRL